jgi:hypothetical protein
VLQIINLLSQNRSIRLVELFLFLVLSDQGLDLLVLDIKQIHQFLDFILVHVRLVQVSLLLVFHLGILEEHQLRPQQLDLLLMVQLLRRHSVLQEFDFVPQASFQVG